MIGPSDGLPIRSVALGSLMLGIADYKAKGIVCTHCTRPLSVSVSASPQVKPNQPAKILRKPSQLVYFTTAVVDARPPLKRPPTRCVGASRAQNEGKPIVTRHGKSRGNRHHSEALRQGASAPKANARQGMSHGKRPS